MSRQGAVFKRNGSWCFSIDTAAPGARRRQLYRRGFDTKRAALAALHEVQHRLATGTWVEPTRSTTGSYLVAWLDGRRAGGLKPTTMDSYRRMLEANVLPFIGDVPLQALTALDLDRLYSRLLDEGGRAGRPLGARTVRYAHTIVAKALGDAVRKGLVVRNVATSASPPSSTAASAPEMTVWTPPQLATFLDRVRSSEHFPLLRTAAFTGLRRAELCGLRWDDVDLQGGAVVVRRATTAVAGKPTSTTPKSSRSRRTVDLDPETLRVLREHRRLQLEQRLLVGLGWQDTAHVFAMADRRPWHPDTISQAFSRIVAANPDLPRVRLHDLRHTHATHLLAAGVNPRIVSERLGHASVAFTLDRYGHVMPGQQASAAAAVAALVDHP